MEEAATACRHQWSETRRDKPPLGAVPVSQPLIKSHVISLLICPACSLAAEAIGGGGVGGVAQKTSFLFQGPACRMHPSSLSVSQYAGAHSMVDRRKYIVIPVQSIV